MRTPDAEELLRANVRRLIKDRSQAAIAKKLGIAESTFSQFLNGRHSIGLSRIGTLAAALDATVGELFRETDLSRHSRTSHSLPGDELLTNPSTGETNRQRPTAVGVESSSQNRGGKNEVVVDAQARVFGSEQDRTKALEDGLETIAEIASRLLAQQAAALGIDVGDRPQGNRRTRGAAHRTVGRHRVDGKKGA